VGGSHCGGSRYSFLEILIVWPWEMLDSMRCAVETGQQ
jgi:hypothetical protein